jgi:hypothetical protein
MSIVVGGFNYAFFFRQIRIFISGNKLKEFYYLFFINSNLLLQNLYILEKI